VLLFFKLIILTTIFQIICAKRRNKFLDSGYIDDIIGKHVMKNLNDICSYTYYIYE